MNQEHPTSVSSTPTRWKRSHASASMPAATNERPATMRAASVSAEILSHWQLAHDAYAREASTAPPRPADATTSRPREAARPLEPPASPADAAHWRSTATVRGSIVGAAVIDDHIWHKRSIAARLRLAFARKPRV